MVGGYSFTTAGATGTSQHKTPLNIMRRHWKQTGDLQACQTTYGCSLSQGWDTAEAAKVRMNLMKLALSINGWNLARHRKESSHRIARTIGLTAPGPFAHILSWRNTKGRAVLTTRPISSAALPRMCSVLGKGAYR